MEVPPTNYEAQVANAALEIATPSELLARELLREFGVDVASGKLRAFVRARFNRLSCLAHAIHKEI